MILSVSRRTDIPAFYGEWFVNRLREGFVCVRNPFNKDMVSRILLSNDLVDCIVFWTKDASNFLQFLPEIDSLGYKYYFQFTITPYGKEIEPNLREKEDIIKTFIELSNKIGKEKVVWRYDPILFTKGEDISYHIANFEQMCKQLYSYTNVVVISFLDEYKKLDKNKYQAPSKKQIETICENFARIAKQYNLKIQTCAEKNIDGIEKGACIDKQLIESICEYQLKVEKDKTQRVDCLCVESVDVGEYDTCPHFCGYCYANNNKKIICEKNKNNNKSSQLLVGELRKTDKIYDRKVKSLKQK